MTGDDIRKLYFDLRGIWVEIRISHGVSAKRLDLQGIGDEEIMSAKMLYAGPAGKVPEAPFVENDRYVCRYACSPVPENFPFRASGSLKVDDRGDVWIGYWSLLFLKDEGLFENGLRFECEIPESVADKSPTLQIRVNNDLVLEETIIEGGIISRTIDIRQASHGVLPYMEQAREVQRTLMKEFSRVCEKHGLSWYLICGGLIGLLRDGSLIPWDDDLDIAMPRRDYEKLLAAAREEWSEGSDFRLLLPEDYSEKTFHDFMTRLVYMKGKVPGDPFERLEDGERQDIRFLLPVDIYILQDAYDGRIRHFLQTGLLRFCYALALGHRRTLELIGRDARERRKMRVVRFVSRIGSLIPLKTLLRWYQKASVMSTDCGGSRCFQSNGYHACIRYTFDKAWLGEGEIRETEGFVFRLPSDGDSFLRRMYGDYMKYPPFITRFPMFGGETAENSMISKKKG